MRHRVEVVGDADITPLREQHPRAGHDRRVQRMAPGHMDPFAVLQFVTAFRGTDRHDLTLLRGEAVAVGLGQDDGPIRQSFSGDDGADEHHAGQGLVHARDDNDGPSNEATR